MVEGLDGQSCAGGRYANFFRVGHNAFEFVLDFGQYYEDSENAAEVHTRIVTVPTYAKRLLTLLRDAIEQYEASFGPVAD